MKSRQKSTFISFVLALFGVACIFTATGWADEVSSAAEAQSLIDASGASWRAQKTSVFGVPAEQLCGSILHPDAEAASAPSPVQKDAYPSGAPSAWNWRNYGGHDWTTPIRNQNPCGSCYIFGTHAAAEAAMKVQSGTYGYLAEPDLSEQFTLVCPGLGSCAGGYSGDALDFLKNSGSVDETCFPYTASDATPCTNRCANWSDRLHWIDNWGHPGGYPNWTPSVAQIKDAIMAYGPVSTYMKVYTDFRDYYSSGVYVHSFGTYLDGHTVTLVGWDDALQCWIAKNSWGTGWGESGWFRIKWGEVDIERQTEWVDAGLPNLTDYPHTGWTYSLVPRNTTGTTWGSCPLPATLSGNTNNTYLNFSGINNGAEKAPPHLGRFYVDDIYNWWATWGVLSPGGGYFANDLGPLTVRGGRHTLKTIIDYNDEVWETNETDADNIEARQFIWSPYGLSNNTPVTRSQAPPKKDSYGYSYPNCDGFSFSVLNNGSDDWWSAVGVLPSSTSADYDLRLHDIGTYTGSTNGFGAYLQSSGYGGSTSDFVIVNDNNAAAGTYYAGAINYNEGTAAFRIEEDTSEPIYTRPGTHWNEPQYRVSSNVLDIFEVYLGAGTYYFLLDQTAGTCDLGMTLYDDETITNRKIGYMSGGYANSAGDGGDEAFLITVPDAGWHGLVVWKVDASDYAKEAWYRIAVGPPAITVTAPDGGENWAVGSSHTITWDPFGPLGTLGSYVSIQISRNGGSSWSTITSSTYNDGSYAWTVTGPVSTTCRVRITSTSYSSYTDTSDANFTIADNAAPTPNPMAWATEPYELNTSQIRMVSTTASDPTGPINYYFDMTGSPTGGTGGTDSGWITSTTYTDSGLLTNHQYGYRVYARDGSLNQTSPSAISYDYTDIESSTGITFGAITSTSIQTRSTNTPSGLTRDSSGLYVRNDTNGSASGWKQNNNLWTSGGLTPNTSYAFRAQTRNGDANATVWSPSSARYTLANPPVADSFSNITQTSIRANWMANGNPAGTQYYCENLTAGTGSGWTTNTNWNSVGLSAGTSYTFRVRARNSEGVATAWVTLGTQATLPSADICECNLNGDTSCNILDYQLFIQDWGRSNCGTPPGTGNPPNDCECDLDTNGSCNILDYQLFIQDWGRNDCP